VLQPAFSNLSAMSAETPFRPFRSSDMDWRDTPRRKATSVTERLADYLVLRHKTRCVGAQERIGIFSRLSKHISGLTTPGGQTLYHPLESPQETHCGPDLQRRSMDGESDDQSKTEHGQQVLGDL
jgi:hypothetical protein